MDDTSLPPVTGDPSAVAAYVASLTGELSRLSRASGLLTLAYLLEIARLEARSISLEGGKAGQAGSASRQGTREP